MFVKDEYKGVKMRKRIMLLLITVALLTGCGADAHGDSQTADGDGSGLDTISDQDGSLAEGELSDATATPAPTQAYEKELKANGFEYDRESLTYELVWSDEFDYEGEPDPEKWGYDIGGNGWGNHELQYYTKGDNVTVTDGMLVIEARKEDMGGREYTSTRLVTKNKGDWIYCKVEAYAKLPSGLGTWPAIWMLPTDYRYGGWPASGEIDIMEHVGYDQDVIVQTVHTQKNHGGNGKGHSVRTEAVSEEFHLYSVEWLPDKLIFYVDGEEQYTYDPNKIAYRTTSDYWPFDQRMHLLINLAFGGDWGGARGVDDSYFPVQFYVDYVRVYQSPEIMELTGQIVEQGQE